MTYEQIREKIQSDYNKLESAMSMSMSTGRRGMKTLYIDFAKALKELNNTVGPFTVDKESFIEQIKYKKDIVAPGVYDAILTYCKDTLKLDIK